MGKIILIEGTDCSGKETQSKMLIDALKKEGYQVESFDFPHYDSPTGRIIGGPYLGKKEICDGWFPEGAANVDAKVASLYYAADRRYHLEKLKQMLQENDVLVLDRYVFSNMAHQGGKIFDTEERHKMYNFIETLEFNLLDLPRPDMVIFLYMPYEQACILKQGRVSLDQHETNKEHLLHAEKTYLELAKLYNFKQVNCAPEGNIRTRENISEEVKTLAKTIL